MILDQISSMDSGGENNDNNSLTRKLTEGFDKITGSLGGITYSINSIGNYQRRQGGLLSSFISKDLQLSSIRNSSLSSIDSNISLQNSLLMKNFDKIDTSLNRISKSLSVLDSVSNTLSSFEGELRDISFSSREILNRLKKSANVSNTVPGIKESPEKEFNNSFEDFSKTRELFKDATDSYNDSFSLVQKELEIFREDVTTYLQIISNKINSIPRYSDAKDNSSLLAGISSSGKATAASINSNANSSNTKLGGFFSKAITGAISMISWDKIGDYIKSQAEVSSKIAVYMGQNAHGESWKTLNSTISEATKRNDGEGRLGSFTQLISKEEYYEAINKALDAGLTNINDLVDATSNLALVAKLLPDITLDLTEGYAKDLLVGYDSGSDVIKGVSMVIKDYSDNMYVASSTLQKSVEKYHTTVTALSKDMTTYVKKMGEYIKVISALDENGLNNLNMEELAEKFTYTPTSEWTPEMFTKAISMGLSGSDIANLEVLGLTDPEAAYRMIAEAMQETADSYKYVNADGSIDLQAFKMFKERFRGFDIKEAMSASARDDSNASKFTRFIDSLDNDTHGTNITDKNNDADMKKAIDSMANDTLSEQVNLTWAQELLNIVEIEGSSNGILGNILNFLNNNGISGGMIGWLGGAFTAKFAGKIATKIGSLFKGGSSASSFSNFTKTFSSKFENFTSKFSSMFKGGSSAATKGSTLALEKFTNATSGATDDIIDASWRYVDDVGSASTKLATVTSNSADDVATGLSKIVANSTDDVAGMSTGLSKIVATTSDDVAGTAAKIGSKSSAALAAVGVAIDGGLAVNKSEEWLGDKSDQSKISSFVGGSLGGTGEGIMSDESVGTKALDIGGGALKGATVGAAIGTVVPVIGNAVGAVVGGAVGAIGSAIGGKNIAKFVDGIGDKAKDLNQGLDNFLEDNLGGFGKGVANFKNGLFEAGGAIVGGAATVIGDVAGGVVGGVKDVVGGIGSGFGKILKGDVLGGLADAGGGLVKGVGSVIGGVGKGIVSAGKGLWKGAKSVAKGIGGFFSGIFGKSDKDAEEAKKKLEEDTASLTGAKESKIETEAKADEVIPVVYEDYKKSANQVDLSSMNSFAYTDREALAYNSLNTPSQNLANYDGISSTSNIKQDYTNLDALNDGNLSLGNQFANSVVGGTYGDLSNNLVKTSATTLGLAETVTPNTTTMGLTEAVAPSPVPTETLLPSSKQVLAEDSLETSMLALRSSIDMLTTAFTSNTEAKNPITKTAFTEKSKSIEPRSLFKVGEDILGDSLGFVAGTMKKAILASPLTKIGSFVGEQMSKLPIIQATKAPIQGLIENIFGKREEGIQSAAADISEQDSSLVETGNMTESYSDTSSSNPVVDAIVTLQENLMIRLDRIIEGKGKTVDNGQKPFSTSRNPYIADNERSVTDQDIRNYA